MKFYPVRCLGHTVATGFIATTMTTSTCPHTQYQAAVVALCQLSAVSNFALLAKKLTDVHGLQPSSKCLDAIEILTNVPFLVA